MEKVDTDIESVLSLLSKNRRWQTLQCVACFHQSLWVKFTSKVKEQQLSDHNN